MDQRENILRIKIVYDSLEELQRDVVFVGGSTVSLYADRATEELRPTDDIDILVEIANYRGYAAIENKLRSKGFSNDTTSKIICRYVVKGITVDVMPTSEHILGFNNIWYPKGFETCIQHEIQDGYIINIFRPEYFVATKLEAFKGRGNNDGRTSADFEDLVFIFNNRTSIWEEMMEADETLKEYLIKELQMLLDNSYIDEWIDSHLEYSQKHRVRFILGNFYDFCN